MSSLDWAVLVAYLLGMLALAGWIGRKQRSKQDYFLGGNDMPPSALAASTIATQCSTNSLLGAPAFVGFAAGGGLLWLQYELAVPLAMLALLFILVPARSMGVTSVYEVLERRLGRKARLTASGSFLLFRGVATGVTIYGVGLIVVAILDVSFAVAVLLTMSAVLAYDILGGLRAVVISDVIQLILLTAAVVCSVVMIGGDVGWSEIFAERTETLAFGSGFDGETYSFWPMLIGGLFLYVAYYGADQSQAQRVLAAKDSSAAQRVLLLNGLMRFPLVLAYCVLGLALAAVARANPEFLGTLPLTAAGEPNINLVFPTYVLEAFAPGLVGLVIVGLLAAAMSSIDSALNSLSAATVEDFLGKSERSPQQALRLSRLVTTAWGAACVLFSFQVERIAPTVLEAINMIGSLANGPLLALVLCAIVFSHIRERAALAGFVVGALANAAVALTLTSVSWLWWNVIGCLAALFTALLLEAFAGQRLALARYPISTPRPTATVLAIGFVAILCVCVGLDRV